jgi:hypothetical protein
MKYPDRRHPKHEYLRHISSTWRCSAQLSDFISVAQGNDKGAHFAHLVKFRARNPTASVSAPMI